MLKKSQNNKLQHKHQIYLAARWNEKMMIFQQQKKKMTEEALKSMSKILKSTTR